jgi:DNA-binding transcriptional ArsR family regulator
VAVETFTIDRPEQLKALGHPLRLRVLEVLGETGEKLTNRELAMRLGVDPGHLHFHVRMLLNAGLIQLAEGGRRREKPYRAVASSIKVAPELIATGDADDARAAMLEEVRYAYTSFSGGGRFRSAQLTVRVDPEQFRAEWAAMTQRLLELEEPQHETLVITLFWHPRRMGDGELDVTAEEAAS